MLSDVDYVLRKLDWMREQHIWPNGLRYLWTDAFGVVLLARVLRCRYRDRDGDARCVSASKRGPAAKILTTLILQ